MFYIWGLGKQGVYRLAKNVVIVESPAKAKTIERYLGKDYRVAASMGHVRDLPERKLGVDIENDFEPTYTVLRGKQKVLAALKKSVSTATTVFMATDLDREGEAIAWHLCAALGLDPAKVQRVTFNEITKSAITAAFARPGRINTDKVSASPSRASVAVMCQDSAGTKARISRSRSTTSRTATLWTRPADRPLATFFHRRGLSL